MAFYVDYNFLNIDKVFWRLWLECYCVNHKLFCMMGTSKRIASLLDPSICLSHHEEFVERFSSHIHDLNKCFLKKIRDFLRWRSSIPLLAFRVIKVYAFDSMTLICILPERSLGWFAFWTVGIPLPRLSTKSLRSTMASLTVLFRTW